MVASANTSITEVYTHENTLYWCEGRPQEDGKHCIVQLQNGEKKRISPELFDVGHKVHEYLYRTKK